MRSGGPSGPLRVQSFWLSPAGPECSGRAFAALAVAAVQAPRLHLLPRVASRPGRPGRLRGSGQFPGLRYQPGSDSHDRAGHRRARQRHVVPRPVEVRLREARNPDQRKPAGDPRGHPRGRPARRAAGRPPGSPPHRRRHLPRPGRGRPARHPGRLRDIGLEKSAFLHASDLLEPEEDEEPTGEEGDEAFEEAEPRTPSAPRPTPATSGPRGRAAADGEGNGRQRAAPARSALPPAAARHLRHAQEGADPPRPGHQGAHLHQGLPGHRPDLPARAASWSTCRTPPRWGSAARSRARNCAPSCARWWPACSAEGCRRHDRPHRRRGRDRGAFQARGGVAAQHLAEDQPQEDLRPGAGAGPAGDLAHPRHHPRPLQRQGRRAARRLEGALQRDRAVPEAGGPGAAWSGSTSTTRPMPLFDKFDIENEIRDLFKARCDLPTGGYIIIQPTEALVSIDVNTGRYTGKKDPEKTILKTNLEAAREIARQIRLRDIGGIIVCDFIDMETQAEPRAGAAGAAHPPRPRPGPHQGACGLRAGPGRDDPAAGAAVALALDDHRMPRLQRHRPGVHARSGGAAAGAVAQAGGPGAAGAAARRPAAPRGGAVPAGGGAASSSTRWGR